MGWKDEKWSLAPKERENSSFKGNYSCTSHILPNLKSIQCNFVSGAPTNRNSACAGCAPYICVREISHILQRGVIFKASVLIWWAWNALKCFPWVLNDVPLHTLCVEKYLREKNESPSCFIFKGRVIKRRWSLLSRGVIYRVISVLGGLWPSWGWRRRPQSHSHTSV